MIHRVLIGIGGTPRTPAAIRYAVELCRAHQAELTAVAVVAERQLQRVGATPFDAREAGPREETADDAAALVERGLDELQRRCHDEAVVHWVHREQGEPFDTLIDQARSHDLTILGLPNLLEPEFWGDEPLDPADRLDRLMSLGVRPIFAAPERFRPVRKVLVACGGALSSSESLRHFVQLQPWPNVQMRLMSCERDEASVRRELGDAASYCRAFGLEVDTVQRVGPPELEILAEADDWNADLIVVGISARRPYHPVDFGITAIELVRHANRPLFIDR